MWNALPVAQPVESHHWQHMKIFLIILMPAMTFVRFFQKAITVFLFCVYDILYTGHKVNQSGGNFKYKQVSLNKKLQFEFLCLFAKTSQTILTLILLMHCIILNCTVFQIQNWDEFFHRLWNTHALP